MLSGWTSWNSPECANSCPSGAAQVSPWPRAPRATHAPCRTVPTPPLGRGRRLLRLLSGLPWVGRSGCPRSEPPALAPASPDPSQRGPRGHCASHTALASGKGRPACRGSGSCLARPAAILEDWVGASAPRQEPAREGGRLPFVPWRSGCHPSAGFASLRVRILRKRHQDTEQRDAPRRGCEHTGGRPAAPVGPACATLPPSPPASKPRCPAPAGAVRGTTPAREPVRNQPSGCHRRPWHKVGLLILILTGQR